MSLGAGEILACTVGISSLSKLSKESQSGRDEIGASTKNSARSEGRFFSFLPALRFKKWCIQQVKLKKENLKTSFWLPTAEYKAPAAYCLLLYGREPPTLQP